MLLNCKVSSSVDASRGDRIALSLEALVQGGMSLLECGTVESDGDAGADHHLVGGAVVGAVTEVEDLGLRSVHQFAQHFELGVQVGVVIDEFEDLGDVAHVFDVLLNSSDAA